MQDNTDTVKVVIIKFVRVNKEKNFTKKMPTWFLSIKWLKQGWVLLHGDYVLRVEDKNEHKLLISIKFQLLPLNYY